MSIFVYLCVCMWACVHAHAHTKQSLQLPFTQLQKPRQVGMAVYQAGTMLCGCTGNNNSSWVLNCGPLSQQSSAATTRVLLSHKHTHTYTRACVWVWAHVCIVCEVGVSGCEILVHHSSITYDCLTPYN